MIRVADSLRAGAQGPDRRFGWKRAWYSAFRTMSVLLALAAGFGGCPCMLAPETVDDVDFAELKDFTDKVMDLNDIGWGLRQIEDVQAEYSRPDRQVEISDLPEIGLRYMVDADPAQRRQVVLVPGTANKLNLRLDVQVDLVRDDELGISVHTGFRQAAMVIRTDLLPRLNPDYDTTLVGYSLGGAIAVLLAEYLPLDGFAVSRVITLGQPPVTDADGAAALADLPLLRVIAGADPVPRLEMGPYRQFGPGLALLDGPEVVRISADEPAGSPAMWAYIGATQQPTFDHSSYRERVNSKAGTTVYAVQPSAMLR